MLKMFTYTDASKICTLCHRVLMQQLQVDEYLNEYSVLYKCDLFGACPGKVREIFTR